MKNELLHINRVESLHLTNSPELYTQCGVDIYIFINEPCSNKLNHVNTMFMHINKINFKAIKRKLNFVMPHKDTF